MAAGAVVVLCGAAWLITSFLNSDDSEGLEGLAFETPSEVVAAEIDAVTPPTEEERAEGRIAAVARIVESVGSGLWAGELGGITGRVVEEDGTPVADLPVALLQADITLLLAADWANLGEDPPELVIADTMTDVEGRFRMDGAYDSSFQGIGVDLRGPRSTLRVLDMQTHHGELTDIGDIVLPVGCTIFGRVVDGAGAPVPGARVRVVPSPVDNLDEFLSIGIQDVRSDCTVGITSFVTNESGSPVVEIPPFARRHIDDLPIPTSYTDLEGNYRMDGVPIGALIQAVDKPGLLGVARVVTTKHGENALEDVVLTTGRTLTGIVIDEESEPVAGIEVVAGSELVFGEVAILHPAGTTGADGRFTLTGLPDTGNIMACGRRHADEAWVGALASAGEEIEIELASTYGVTVNLVDAAGEPVRGAKVELAPSHESDSPMAFLGPFMSLGAAPREARLKETEPGMYVCAELATGTYEVTARPLSLASAHDSFELDGEDSVLTIVCERGQTLQLHVTDAVTQDGIPGARASVLDARRPPIMMKALAVGRTGKDGMVALGPYKIAKDEESSSWFWVDGQHVIVQHPQYADTSIELAEGTEIAEVAMVRGGEIAGRITWGVDAPQSLYMLMLENRKGVDGLMQAFLPPRMGRTSLTGEFRFTNLPPGEYRITVLDRFLDKDPLGMMMLQQEPTVVHREDDIMVESSVKTDLAIDLSPTGRGQTAKLAGRIMLDGRPVQGARVRVSGSGARASATTDEYGDFETDDFLCQNGVRVRVTGPVTGEDGETDNVDLYNEQITPLPQSVHRLDIDLQAMSLKVHVISKSNGASIPDASVEVRISGSRGNTQNRKTDSQGMVTVTILNAGEHAVTASAPGFADSKTDVDMSEGDGLETVTVELQPAVVCAGTVDLGAVAQGGNGAYMRIEGDTDSSWNRLDKDDLADDNLCAFSVDGLQPGHYEAQLWSGGQMSAPYEFDLPEGGDANLLIVFQPAGE
jgi:hypothetical protein